jgi:hypothetical protein
MSLTLLPEYPNIGPNASFDFKVHLIDECMSAKFANQIIQNIEVLQQSAEYTLPQYLPFPDYSYYPLETLGLDCGPVQQKLVLLEGMIPPPSWIVMDANRVNTVRVSFSQASRP